MKIFLDTTNLEEIQKATNFGLLDGITTNPALAAKAGLPFPELILKACEIVKDGGGKRRSGIHRHRRDAARGA